MAFELGFGMTCGVWIILSRKPFCNYFALQGVGMLWWLTTHLVTMTRCIGTWILSDWCTIGRWNLYFVSIGRGDEDNLCSIPSEGRSLVKTFTKFSFPTLIAHSLGRASRVLRFL